MIVKLIRYATRRDAWFNKARCQALVQEATARWRYKTGQGDVCELDAHYQIDGVNYCRRHAGYVVLDRLASDHVIISGDNRHGTAGQTESETTDEVTTTDGEAGGDAAGPHEGRQQED